MSGAAHDLVDWEFAVRVGRKLASDGPLVSPAEASAAVAELRRDAARSTELVREFTGLNAPANTAPVLVVDRAGWVQANADGFAAVLAPVAEQLSAKLSAKAKEKKAGTKAVAVSTLATRKIAGAEVGGLLGFLSSKVLGQFDPFFDPHGRLLLVAPNIVHIERELAVDPTDFRLWVCLHEETHRVQFTANPWLRDHLLAQVGEIAEMADAGSLLDDVGAKIKDLIKGEGATGSVMDLVSSPEQREVLDRVTAVMSLLEGHADVVMDGVGPSVIPSVEKIRATFSERRKGVGTLDRLIRRLLGLEAKMAQYRDGATFVRHVIDEVGMERFNTVWTGPETLPLLSEIHEPATWIARVQP